jgi:hypothetical protein
VERINHQEFWNCIPLEEKLLIMHRAQGSGVIYAMMVILGASGVAIGYKFMFVFWGSVLIAPIVYKLVSNGCFKQHQSQLMLLYLGARSAVRRYAYRYNSVDLTLELLLRGTLLIVREPITEGSEPSKDEEVLDSRKNDLIPVWIALFCDTVVVIGEGSGGARLYFAHNFVKGLGVRGFSLNDEGDYSRRRVVALRRPNEQDEYLLQSDTPAALIVFEKKLNHFLNNTKM